MLPHTIHQGLFTFSELRERGWSRNLINQWLPFTGKDDLGNSIYSISKVLELEKRIDIQDAIAEHIANRPERTYQHNVTREVSHENARVLSKTDVEQQAVYSELSWDIESNDDWTLISRDEVIERGWGKVMVKNFLPVRDASSVKNHQMFFLRRVEYIETHPYVQDRMLKALTSRGMLRDGEQKQEKLERKKLRHQLSILNGEASQEPIRPPRDKRVNDIMRLMREHPEGGGPLWNTKK